MAATADMTAPPAVPLTEVLWKVDSRAAARGSGYVARFVPYINAAIVAGLLDQWVGADHWWDTYQTVHVASAKPDQMHQLEECHLTILVPDGSEVLEVQDPDRPDRFRTFRGWREVTKSDVGAAPSGGAEMGGKGARSDAFKRAACLKWGVGRNVYTLPNLWAPVDVPNVSELTRCYPKRDGSTQQAIQQQLAAQGFKDAGSEASPDEYDDAVEGGPDGS